MQKRAVIYIRVSDPSQIENNSLETQEKVCMRYGKSKEYEIVKIFREEGKSAKTFNKRAELKKLLLYCGKKSNGISAVIVYKIDRFSRNLTSGLEIEALLAQYGAVVLSATEPYEMGPMGTAMKNIMMVLAQLDNELKGERVKENMQAVFNKGLWPFKCPIGYKRKYKTKEQNKGIPPIIEQNLAPIIRNMYIEAAKGIHSKSQLARIMNLAGFEEYYKKKATHKIVKKILEKTFYYGYMYAKKWDMYSWGKHEALIDKITWEKAYQRVILKKRKYKYQDDNLYPLKGLIKCELCGDIMTTCPSRGRGGKVYYYECKKRECRKVRINSKSAHHQFMQTLKTIKPSNRVIKLFNFLVFADWNKIMKKRQEEIEKTERRILDKKEQLRSIRKAKDEGIYTINEAKNEAEKLRQEIAILEVENSEIKIEKYNSDIVREFTVNFFNNFDILWEKLDLCKKQILQSKIFPEGITCLKSKEIRTTKLSPSFQFIEDLKTLKVKNVTPQGIEP